MENSRKSSTIENEKKVVKHKNTKIKMTPGRVDDNKNITLSPQKDAAEAVAHLRRLKRINTKLRK